MSVSYLVHISDTNMRRNQFSRLSSDVVRLICKHLYSVADIVAFARTCKFTYRAIAPLFSICSSSGDTWNGLCISITGNVAPITLKRIIGASLYYLTDYHALIPTKEDDGWYFQHINYLKRALEHPIGESLYGGLYTKCIQQNGKHIHAKVVLRLEPGDAKYILREIRSLITMSNVHFYRTCLRRGRKRAKLTE